MVEQMNEGNKVLTLKLLELMQTTGYPIAQHNGQRKFGPPPNWTGPPPPKGCEVFIGKLPRDIFEDELVPIFSTVGTIYEMRLMMDFSGSNRGYAFVTYANQTQAAAAIKQLNGYPIRPQRTIGVVKSVDNCRLYIGNIPKTKTKEELMTELSKRVTGLVDAILYKNSSERNLNRGFAFVEFTSHKAAAMARRELVPGCFKLWGQEIHVDWAEPEPQIDDEVMQKVKVLYVRNFAIWTTPEVIKKVFEETINHKVERVKKIYDYAFIHFYEREHAEIAMAKLQNFNIDGCNIEISWSKPVNPELYHVQKLIRGNAKFNNSLDLAQTLLLYKQHLDKKEYAYSSYKDEYANSSYKNEYANSTSKKEYANSSPKNESPSSGHAGDSPSISPIDFKPAYASASQLKYTFAPAKLEAMCKRYFWMPPVYSYQKYVDPNGVELWVCFVELPQVGMPLLTAPRRIGPLSGIPCYSMQQAYVEAAEYVLSYLKMLRVNVIQQSVPAHPVYSQVPALQNCIRSPYDYPPMYHQTQPVMPINIPTIWRTV